MYTWPDWTVGGELAGRPSNDGQAAGYAFVSMRRLGSLFWCRGFFKILMAKFYGGRWTWDTVMLRTGRGKDI